ncbi:MAG: hypothetical protein HY231_11060 [Acidobacteria bacterium]|nr:hypothetical protein [Acidobacteriota bacterium]
MNIKSIFLATLILFLLTSMTAAQNEPAGFVILLKNGSAVRGRTLVRDEASGRLRVAMTETSSGEAKSYAVIAMEDAESIRASSSDSESIRIKLLGGSEVKCKEFSLNGDTVTIKLGTASHLEVRWDEIASISFNG